MAKKNTVAKGEVGAPPGHQPDWVDVNHPEPPPGKKPMLPTFWATRGPETPEEHVAWEQWNRFWKGLFEGVTKTPRPAKSRGPGKSTVAIGVVWTLYVQDNGLPTSMRGLVKAVHDYATEEGLLTEDGRPLIDDLDDRMSREFLTPIVNAINRRSD
jgi:hypothetical protein